MVDRHLEMSLAMQDSITTYIRSSSRIRTHNPTVQAVKITRPLDHAVTG